jgi:D-alanyl-D-alanine carboxypeptidase/D-alanyl-D-alanine-endopeptidase (penicillin-binding protein 4)
MTILDAQTGSILFQHAKDVGLPPASSLKTITAAAALHYLGEDYTYETLLQYSGDIDTETGFLDGYVYIVGKTKSILVLPSISLVYNRQWRSIIR